MEFYGSRILLVILLLVLGGSMDAAETTEIRARQQATESFMDRFTGWVYDIFGYDLSPGNSDNSQTNSTTTIATTTPDAWESIASPDHHWISVQGTDSDAATVLNIPASTNVTATTTTEILHTANTTTPVPEPTITSLMSETTATTAPIPDMVKTTTVSNTTTTATTTPASVTTTLDTTTTTQVPETTKIAKNSVTDITTPDPDDTTTTMSHDPDTTTTMTPEPDTATTTTTTMNSGTEINITLDPDMTTTPEPDLTTTTMSHDSDKTTTTTPEPDTTTATTTPVPETTIESAQKPITTTTIGVSNMTATPPVSPARPNTTTVASPKTSGQSTTVCRGRSGTTCTTTVEPETPAISAASEGDLLTSSEYPEVISVTDFGGSTLTGEYNSTEATGASYPDTVADTPNDALDFLTDNPRYLVMVLAPMVTLAVLLSWYIALLIKNTYKRCVHRRNDRRQYLRNSRTTSSEVLI